MIQVRYIKTTHDSFAGEKKFIRGDHALILQMAGFVEIIPSVEKQVKRRKKKTV